MKARRIICVTSSTAAEKGGHENKKLICIIISICLACAAFAGCGKKDDGMETLKSNIAVIKTSDGRTGTAVILDDGSLLAPSHLVDHQKGLTYTVQYPGGMEAQAEILSNDAYPEPPYSDWINSDDPEPPHIFIDTQLMPYDEVMDYLNGLLGSDTSGVDESITAAKVMRSFLENKKNNDGPNDRQIHILRAGDRLPRRDHRLNNNSAETGRIAPFRRINSL